MDKFIKTITRLKRPINYILICVFLISICVFPSHMMLVALTLAAIPVPIQMLILSVIGGSHLIRSWKRDMMDKND